MNILQRGNFSSPAVQSKALSKQDENLPIRNINLEEYGTTTLSPFLLANCLAMAKMTKLEKCTKVYIGVKTVCKIRKMLITKFANILGDVTLLFQRL